MYFMILSQQADTGAQYRHMNKFSKKMSTNLFV